MLSCDEQAELAAAVCATAEALGQVMSANAAELIASDLADYAKQDIVDALRACRRELAGKLTLAAILQRIQASDGRPEPNEAWSLALSASDESESVVLTEEIQLAMSPAMPILAAGDKIGARMAFLAAYQRLVDAARRDARAAKWSLSMGHDPQRRIAAIEEAGRLGRLPAPEVREHLSRLTHAPITQDGSAIAGLITGRAAMPTPEVRERLDGIRQSLKAARERRASEQVAQIEERKRDLAERIARHEQAVEDLTQQRAHA